MLYKTKLKSERERQTDKSIKAEFSQDLMIHPFTKKVQIWTESMCAALMDQEPVMGCSLWRPKRLGF